MDLECRIEANKLPQFEKKTLVNQSQVQVEPFLLGDKHRR